MKVLGLTCNHCGAPLEVPVKTKFVTCGYCSSRLRVQRTASTAYTEVIESLQLNTEKIAQDVETIKLQNDLELLDREWTMGLKSYMVRDRDGEYRIPTRRGSVVGIVMVVGFGVFFTVVASNISLGAGGISSVFPLVGVLFIVVGVTTGLLARAKAGSYQDRKSEYDRERHELLNRIQQRSSQS